MFEELGFIHILSKELWNGHPCCAFGTSAEFIEKNPNTFAALYRAVLTSAAMARDPKTAQLALAMAIDCYDIAKSVDAKEHAERLAVCGGEAEWK